RVGLESTPTLIATLVYDFVVLPLIMWNIWTSRNKYIFEDIQLKITFQAFDEHSLPTSRPIRDVRWQSGDKDAIILDLDGGALTNNPRKLGFGGLVRNHEGVGCYTEEKINDFLMGNVKEEFHSFESSGTGSSCGDPVIAGTWSWRLCTLFSAGVFKSHILGKCLLKLVRFVIL
ncbi:hypothetical protein A2U01_0018591, partial [Trifolium medium]|nr:hypothetical protein [Trifolium medium]